MNESNLSAPSWIPACFAELEQSLNGGKDSALHQLRRRAAGLVQEAGFPSTKNEDWKYTNLLALLKNSFELPREAASAEDFGGLVYAGERPTAVFLNGLFQPALSALHAPPDGVSVQTIGEALRAGGESAALLHAMLEEQISPGAGVFTLLNAAFLTEGLIIRIGRGKECSPPITVVFAAHGGTRALSVHPRVLVVAEAGSRSRIVEKYSGTGAYFTNALTTISAGDGACVEHVRVQTDSPAAYHVSRVELRAGHGTTVRTHGLTFGAVLARNEVQVALNGEGGSAELNGLTVITDMQHADNHTVIDHTAPHCESHELYKGIYGGEAKGIFDGTIIVRPGAQKTSAIQASRSLLLSDKATSNSKPQLKIWADDVKCTHGATVGQLDEDALFYARSRGIPKPEALRLLTEAFGGEILTRIPSQPLRELLLELFGEKTSQMFRN